MIFKRSGNTSCVRGVVAFLTECAHIDACPLQQFAPCGVDAGFFEDALLSFLEARGIPYIIVAKLTQTAKRRAAGPAKWNAIDENYAWVLFAQAPRLVRASRFHRHPLREERRGSAVQVQNIGNTSGSIHG